MARTRGGEWVRAGIEEFVVEMRIWSMNNRGTLSTPAEIGCDHNMHQKLSRT